MTFKARPSLSLPSSQSLSRRSVLRGVGVAVALPWLDAMAPRSARAAAGGGFAPWQAPVTPQPRVIFCYVPNGKNIGAWLPAATGPLRALPPTLQGLAAQQKNFSVISGLGHPRAEAGHGGADVWLTGAHLKARPGSDYTNTVSIDQVIAETQGTQTRFSSLQLSDQSGTGVPGHSHTLSFDRAGTPLPAESSPARLFDRLFVADGASSQREAAQRLDDRRSILDAVKADADGLAARLGADDRSKLGEYLEAVRATETRVRRLQSWTGAPKAQVGRAGLALQSQAANAHDREAFLDVMLNLSYLALVTDTTRVITFEWSREAGGFGGGGENHHELSHHGGDAQMLQKLAVIDQFHVARLARFLEVLAATKEGGGAALDSTIVVYGCGMNSGAGGEHSPFDLPLLIAGGKRLGMVHGKHLRFAAKQAPGLPLANVWLTLAQRLGAKAATGKGAGAGFADATGVMPGL